MKALKSDLAKRVLADPKASGQLRRFLATRMLEAQAAPDVASRSAPADTSGSGVIEVRTGEGTTRRFKPVIVPNA